MSTTKEEINMSTTKEEVNKDLSISSASSPDVEKAGDEAANIISQRTKPFVALVACAAALGGLIFGYDIVSAIKNLSST